MSTMTTTQRGTQALNVSSTQNQNTAPVYEFECLFTHDLRKKKKTWHDGSLRFHTFNRRIMVYDDSKNFVGDLHYRDGNELRDGDELKLDKGVLVDVGRRIGQTDTDLTEVLDRGRHGDNPPQTRNATPAATHRGMQRMSSSNTQGRPKSLAAVLGASQGPIGRARLAVKSPYEQIHMERPEPVRDGRTSKRQKLAMDKENALTDSSGIRPEQQRQSPQLSPAPPAALRAPLSVRKINAVTAVIELSSDDDIAHSPSFSSAFGSSRSRQKGTKAVRNPPAKLDLAPKPARPKKILLPSALKPTETAKPSGRAPEKQSPTTKLTLRVEPAQIPMKSQDKQKPLIAPKLPIGDARTSSNAQGKQKTLVLPGHSAPTARTSSGPTSSLRFAPQRPRSKIMYKDLLPSSFVASRPESSKSVEAISCQGELPLDTEQSRPITSSQDHRKIPQSGMDVFDISSLESLFSLQQPVSSLAGPLLRQSSNPPATIPTKLAAQRSVTSPTHQASSPLFCSQSPRAATSPMNQKGTNSFAHSPIKTPMLAQKVYVEPTMDDELLEDSPTSAKQTEHGRQTPAVSKLTLMDQRLMMPPSRFEELSTPQANPPAQFPAIPIDNAIRTPETSHFRRVLSESDSPTPGDTRPTVSPLVRIPSALNGIHKRHKALMPEPRQPFKGPAKLQRAHSDTSTMLQVEMQRPIGRLNVNVTEVAEEGDDGDMGPWSSREAFLLFDRWPSGRQKPDYDRGADGFVRPQNTHRDDGRSLMGFRPAGVLRDGVDI